MNSSTRFHLPGCLCLGASLLANSADAQQTLGLAPATNRVGRYEKIEFQLNVPRSYTNPFNPREVDLVVALRAPDGQSIEVPAFYRQDYQRLATARDARQRAWLYPAGLPVWNARFAPSQVGSYEARAVLNDRAGKLSSAPVRFECVASTNHGFLRVARRDPRFLEFEDGAPFFGIGQNLAFIGEQQYVKPSNLENIFRKLSDQGANYLRIWACSEDWALAIEARKSAWGRSWGGRGPVVTVPGADAPLRKVVRLSSSNATLRVEPSHPVALRPATRYVVTASVRTTNGQLRVDLQGTQSRWTASTADQSWTSLRHEFTTGGSDYWLNNMILRFEGRGEAWVSQLSLKDAAGGSELLWEADVERPVRGFYNPLDSFLLDELVTRAEGHGLYLQLCLLTRDLYMNALKEPTSPDYRQAVADAKNFFRYAIARWGYSTSVAAWEYWNEMNPGLPTDQFYTELGQYFEQADPYRHLRTTSTWGPSARDGRHEKLDLADVHFYLRPPDKPRLRDEVEAVLDRTRWIREQAPTKPAHLGEFGLANEKWQPTEEMKSSRDVLDFHNGLWASALSGTSTTALFWWWDRLDQRNHYPHYRPLARFVKDVPWNGGDLQSYLATTANDQVRVIGLHTPQRAWLWLFHRAAAWQQIVIEQRTPAEVRDVELTLPKLSSGDYRARWWDTREGKTLREEPCSIRDGVLRVKAPAFTHDIACTVEPAK